MGNKVTSEQAKQVNTTDYGIELEEVDFKEFDRRKTPRLNNYPSFVQYVDSFEVKPVVIIAVNTKSDT